MVLCHNQVIPHQNTSLAASQRNNNCQNSNLCFPFLSWCSATIPVIISLCKHSVSYFRSSSDEKLFPVQDVNLRALIAGRSLFRLSLSGTTYLLTFDNAVLGKIQGDGRKFLERFKSYFGSQTSSQSLNEIHIYRLQPKVKSKETVGNSWSVLKVILVHKYHHNH